MLRAKANRISFQTDMAVRPDNLVFIKGTFANTWQEYLPYACLPGGPHRMAAPVPAVEVTDNTDALGIGGPDGEMHTRDVLMRGDMRPKHAPKFFVAALAHQIFVKIRQDRIERERVFGVIFDAR